MKKTEEISKYREMGVGELETKARDLESELLNLRFRKVTGQLDHSAQLNTIRRSIARVKTVMSQSRAAENEQAAS